MTLIQNVIRELPFQASAMPVSENSSEKNETLNFSFTSLARGMLANLLHTLQRLKKKKKTLMFLFLGNKQLIGKHFAKN